MKFFLIFFVCFLKSVRSHSWIACSDYTEKNGRYWSASKCRGFPRDASRYAQKYSFGQDRGYNHQPIGGRACKTRYSGRSYTSSYPKAVYFAGQQVIIAHPMKNHGADYCTNRFIPDHGSFIYRGRRNTDRNQYFSHYRSRVVANLGVSEFGYKARNTRKYPKPGYQNAPAFCRNTDKAMATYSFNVPKTLRKGEYTFVWSWSFNSLRETYSTCFDVIIVSSKEERDKILKKRGMNLYVACGGRTSDLSRGSTIGCNTKNKIRPSSKATTIPASTTTRRPRTSPTIKPRLALQTTLETQRKISPTIAPTSARVALNAYQIVGELKLDTPRNGVTKRYVSVEFDCLVQVKFSNAKVVEFSSDTFILVQNELQQLASQKIFFNASFQKPCDLINKPPVVIIERDE